MKNSLGNLTTGLNSQKNMKTAQGRSRKSLEAGEAQRKRLRTKSVSAFSGRFGNSQSTKIDHTSFI